MDAKYGVDQWKLEKIQTLIHPLLVIPVINGRQQYITLFFLLMVHDICLSTLQSQNALLCLSCSFGV